MAAIVINVMKDTEKTFCIGYWQIINNKKRSTRHYSEHLPETLKMLSGCNVVYFYNKENNRKQAEDIAYKYNINFIPKKILINELPAYEAAEKFLKRTEEFGSNPFLVAGRDRKKEKAREHYFIDYSRGGPEAYKSMLSVWLSKVPLMAMIMDENPFSSRSFAWVDASISRFNKKRDYYDIHRLNDADGKISFYRGKRGKNLKKLILNASYLSGDQEAWSSLLEIYKEEMDYQQYEVYPNDEETVLDACALRSPSLFRMINPKRNIILIRALSRMGLGMYWNGWGVRV